MIFFIQCYEIHILYVFHLGPLHVQNVIRLRESIFRNGESKIAKLNDSSRMIQVTSGPTDARIFFLSGH